MFMSALAGDPCLKSRRDLWPWRLGHEGLGALIAAVQEPCWRAVADPHVPFPNRTGRLLDSIASNPHLAHALSISILPPS
jgi:hypothetical protein